MKTKPQADIEADMDTAFGEKYRTPSPMQAWFDERPELYAAVIAKAVDGEVPAMTMFLYLVDRYEFPLSESRFRHMIRQLKVERRRDQRNERKDRKERVA